MKKRKPFDPDLVEAIQKLTPEQREAAHRVAKTRLRPFFADPKAMICLREMTKCQS